MMCTLYLQVSNLWHINTPNRVLRLQQTSVKLAGIEKGWMDRWMELPCYCRLKGVLCYILFHSIAIRGETNTASEYGWAIHRFKIEIRVSSEDDFKNKESQKN